jgi:hypothetical protein
MPAAAKTIVMATLAINIFFFMLFLVFLIRYFRASSVLLSLNRDLAASEDVEALGCRLPVELAAVEGVPRASLIVNCAL